MLLKHHETSLVAPELLFSRNLRRSSSPQRASIPFRRNVRRSTTGLANVRP